MLQWLVRYGLKIMQDSQNLSLYNYGEAEYWETWATFKNYMRWDLAKILQYLGWIAYCSDGSKWFAGIIPGSITEVIVTNIVTKSWRTIDTAKGA